VIVETNVDPQSIMTGDDTLQMEQLNQQIQGITDRAQEKLGKP